MGRYVRRTPEGRFWRKVDRSGECWEWQATSTSGGYGNFSIAPGVTSHAQRVAWILTYGAVPPGLFVCHRCDNRLCVRPSHLFLGDALANTRDMDSKGRGRRPVGEMHPRAKLSRTDVETIRARYEPGKGGALARAYGVSDSVISRVVNGKAWR